MKVNSSYANRLFVLDRWTGPMKMKQSPQDCQRNAIFTLGVKISDLYVHAN